MHLLVPIDFSELTPRALNMAKALAGENGTKITLIHVVEPVHQPFEEIMSSPAMDDLNVLRREQADQAIEAWKRTLLAEGVETQTVVLSGSPWRQIVDYAKMHAIDTIVLPTHGRTGLQHFLIGSTAERVLQHAPCSVLVVR